MLYKLRVECRADIDKIIPALELVSYEVTQKCIDGFMVPDCDLVFSSGLAKEEIIFELSTINDLHVACQTIELAENYTGKRN